MRGVVGTGIAVLLPVYRPFVTGECVNSCTAALAFIYVWHSLIVAATHLCHCLHRCAAGRAVKD